jgi:hypothetical protein
MCPKRYYVIGTPETRGVYVGQLDGPETRRLLDADSAAAYTSSGQLLFARQGTLLAQNFDPVRLALVGTPYLAAEQLAQSSNTAASLALSASAVQPFLALGASRKFPPMAAVRCGGVRTPRKSST